MTGNWSLKENLDPYKCLQISDEDILEIVDLWFEPVREPKESDQEHILKMVRDGYMSGQFDSGVDY